MSTNYVEIVPIDWVKPHPNADKLEIAIIKGLTSVVPKGTFERGQHVVFFPPDILIPEVIAEKLGVKKYLKHSLFDGIKCQCRVAACRLRGEPSFGFIVPMEKGIEVAFPLASILGRDQTYALGDNVDAWFDARKYEPPLRPTAEDAERDDANFHKYTSIEHYWRFPDAIAEGTQVRITEKIHGTNSRVGFIRKPDGTFEYMAGSHRVRRKKPEEGRRSLYWLPLLQDGRAENLLFTLSKDKHSVIIFGEIYGAGIQDMDYGTPQGYRVFDISVDGKYLGWDEVRRLCDWFQIETVPLLYQGPFSADLVKQFTYGPTTLAEPGQIKSAFKDREGCVITPLAEQFYAPTGGRLILKSVSADYLDRKGATDDE